MKQNQICVIALIALFQVVLFHLNLFAQENLPALIKKIQPSIVMITTYDDNGDSLSRGTGFFVNEKGDVISNRHVFEGFSKAEIKASNGKSYTVKELLAQDIEGDLIKVSVDIPLKHVYKLKISTIVPEVGEKIIVIGNPYGLEQTVSDGIVSAVREIPNFGKIIQITAPISPGSSGSPVINLKGNVIGVATYMIANGQNLNFAVPSIRVVKIRNDTSKISNMFYGCTSNDSLKMYEIYDHGIKYVFAGDWENALVKFKFLVENGSCLADLAYSPLAFCLTQLGKHDEAKDIYQKIVSINPIDASGYINRGEGYEFLQQYEDAIKSYQKAIKIDPSIFVAHIYLGNLYYKIDSKAEAIKIFEQAILLQPDDEMGYSRLESAIITLETDKNNSSNTINDAISFLNQLIKIHTKNPYAYRSLGTCYFVIKKYQESINAFNKALQLIPNNAYILSKIGDAYSAQKDFKEAINAYNKVLQIDPNFPTIYQNIGDIYKEQKMYKEAINAYSLSLRGEQANYAVFIELGDIYVKQKQFNDAIKIYKKGIIDKPSSSILFRMKLRDLYKELRMFEEAIEISKSIIKDEPNDSYGYSSIGDIYKEAKMFNEAITAFTKAIQLNPNDVLAFGALSTCYLKIKKYENAIELYKGVINKNPELTRGYLGLASVYMEAGRHKDAIISCKKAITLKPNDAFLYVRLGQIYKKAKMYNEAEAEFKQAIKIKPDDVISHAKIGDFYREIKKFDNAVFEYNTAINLKPNYGFVYISFGDAYRENKMYQKAIDKYTQALNADTNFADRAYYGLGLAYKDSFLFQNAKDAFLKAVSFNTKLDSAHFELGLISLKMDSIIQALNYYKTLTYLNDELANSLYGFINKKLKDVIIGTWYTHIIISDTSDASINATELKCFVFSNDNSASLIERKCGKTKKNVKETWEYHSKGTYFLSNDTIHFKTTLLSRIREEFDQFVRGSSGMEWVKTIRPSYEKPIADGSEDRFIIVNDLINDFKQKKVILNKQDSLDIFLEPFIVK